MKKLVVLLLIILSFQSISFGLILMKPPYIFEVSVQNRYGKYIESARGKLKIKEAEGRAYLKIYAEGYLTKTIDIHLDDNVYVYKPRVVLDDVLVRHYVCDYWGFIISNASLNTNQALGYSGSMYGLVLYLPKMDYDHVTERDILIGINTNYFRPYIETREDGIFKRFDILLQRKWLYKTSNILIIYVNIKKGKREKLLNFDITPLLLFGEDCDATSCHHREDIETMAKNIIENISDQQMLPILNSLNTYKTSYHAEIMLQSLLKLCPETRKWLYNRLKTLYESAE